MITSPQIRTTARSRQGRLYFCQIPDAADVLSPGAYKLTGILDRFRRQQRSEPTDDELARAMGCSRGQIQRYLAELKVTTVPGEDYPFLEVSRRCGRRILTLLYREGLKGPANGPTAPLSTPVPRPVPDLHDISAGADCNQRRRYMHAESLLFKSEREGENVNVGSFPESLPQAHARDSPESIADPTSEPVPVPAFEGVDSALAGLTANQLRERIFDLEAATNHPNPRVRIQARTDRMAARELLAALEGTGEPVPTPKVEAIAPRPVIPTAPAPRPSVLTLVGRLKRVAGPEPIEALARRLSEDFRDAGSIAFYRQVAGRVRSGQLKAEDVLSAYKHAKSPTAKSPGAIFTAFIRRLE